jgi:hypothetical protein
VLRKPLWEDNYPIHAAAAAGRLDLVRSLLPARRGRLLPTRGAEAMVNRKDDDTWTPSHYCCYYGHATVLRELLAQGADVSVTNLNGCGLLQFAAGQGHEQCAILLLQQNADARHTDEDHNTPSSLARQLRPAGWARLEILCLLCRDFLPLCAALDVTHTTWPAGGVEQQQPRLRVVGFEPRRRNLLAASACWAMEAHGLSAQPEPEPEPEPVTVSSLDPAAVAAVLLRPVRELKEQLSEAGVDWHGLLLVEKHELAEHLVAASASFAASHTSAERTRAHEEGVPPHPPV